MGINRAHPAGVAVLNALGNGALAVKTVVLRGDDVAAVAVEEPTRSIVVVCERHGEAWDVPSSVGGSGGTFCGEPSERPDVTEPVEPVVNLISGQTGAPQHGTERPLAGWMHVAGVAARDAVSVHVVTEVDSHQAVVEDDGFFLALVYAPCACSPSIHVEDHAGMRTQVHV